MNNDLHKTLVYIANSHALYNVNAYYFILDALGVTSKKIKKKTPAHPRHLSGQELSIGIKDYAIARFGCMSHTVMNLWGIHATSDFGAIVYHLIDAALLGKSGEDSIDDFKEVFNFADAFLKPFEA